MAGGGAEEESSLENTPTYAVAIAVAVFIGLSLLVERLIHRLKKYLKKKNQKPLRKVLDKLTEELMLLGFISLLLTVFQNRITRICMGKDFTSHMLPCKAEELKASSEAKGPPAEAGGPPADESAHRRLLALLTDVYDARRMLASGGSGYCEAKGKKPFVSVEGLHQLHIFIFVLAITHVVYSLLTVLLGFARVYHWKQWEAESRDSAQTQLLSSKADLEKRYCERLKNGKSIGFGFVDRRSHACYENPFTLWILCFFQQFFASVSREDYLVFRVGFLSTHQLTDTFNFRDYVIRSMEMDFKSVIGISWWLWAFVVLFLLLNVYGWYTYFWAAFIPTVLILMIGMKQQHIISVLALQAKRHALDVIDSQRRDPEKQEVALKCKDMGEAVTPSNDLFWFKRPKILLRLIHFVIFQNSFELAVFFWLWGTFGWNSCILGNHTLLIVRIVVGIATIILASYSTLPIYALVTQMGSHMKQTAVFTQNVSHGLDLWKAKAKAKTGGSPRSSTHSNGSNGSAGKVQSVDSLPEDEPHVQSIVQSRGIEMTRPDIEDKTARQFQKLYGKQVGLERLRTCKMPNQQQD
ncbi:hypothetical protein R1sor_008162 [Riccia sorocarpa]|uniref:MLO-like protein n=1 Tax=Riccia sorocarpa TaxID=122646 RepID=A0ABD3HWR1_9MARC